MRRCRAAHTVHNHTALTPAGSELERDVLERVCFDVHLYVTHWPTQVNLRPIVKCYYLQIMRSDSRRLPSRHPLGPCFPDASPFTSHPFPKFPWPQSTFPTHPPIHPPIHPHTHTHAHTHAHTHTLSLPHTHTHTYTQTHTYTHTRTHIHTHPSTHSHTHSHIHARARVDPCPVNSLSARSHEQRCTYADADAGHW